MMRGIRGSNTRPELLLRKALHARGLRYRLHDRNLPGTPDLVFPRFRAVVFVHGCFWHGHGCHMFRWPAQRADFWRDKIGRNQDVDARAVRALTATGWRIGEVWECALRGRLRMQPDVLAAIVDDWLHGAGSHLEIPDEIAEEL